MGAGFAVFSLQGHSALNRVAPPTSNEHDSLTNDRYSNVPFEAFMTLLTSEWGHRLTGTSGMHEDDAVSFWAE